MRTWLGATAIFFYSCIMQEKLEISFPNDFTRHGMTRKFEEEKRSKNDTI